MGLALNIEKINQVLSIYGIVITTEAEKELLQQIVDLPTNQIEDLFNDLLITDVFENKKELF